VRIGTNWYFTGTTNRELSLRGCTICQIGIRANFDKTVRVAYSDGTNQTRTIAALSQVIREIPLEFLV
jgi:hypothetical protein